MPNITIQKYNESWIRLLGDPIILQAISDYFSFKAENYQFHPKYKAKIWDGKIYLYQLSKNLFPIGILFKLHSWLVQQKIEVEYNNFDQSNTIATNDQIEYFSEDVLKFPFPLRDYQLDAIRTALVERKCVILSPTASGKSAIIYTFIRMVQHRNSEYKTLILVPTLSLIDQMVGDFDDYSANMKKPFSLQCKKMFSDVNKTVDKSVVVANWQALQNLQKEFFQQFDCLIVDECHGGSTDGKVVKKLVEYCTKAKYKVGLTGTIHDGKLNELSVQALYGKVYQFTNTSREIERGNLAELMINQVNLHYSQEDAKELIKEKIKLRKAFEGDRIGAALYQQEIKFINDLPYKRRLIEAICKKQQDNILILYRRKSQFGDKLFQQLKKNLKDRQVFLVNGSTAKEQRNEVRAICERSSNAVIVASYQVFSTGVSIKRLHHVILGESVKSKITLFQSIGRGLRLHESKLKVNIYDIVDCLQYKELKNMVMKHSESRAELYEREGFKVKTWEAKTETFTKESLS